MYIAQPKEVPYNIAELANELQVSENHAMKIVHFMAKQDWLITTRGRGGGIRLNPVTLKIPLGQIVRVLQQDSQVVECNNPLRITSNLRFKRYFRYCSRSVLSQSGSIYASRCCSTQRCTL